jgi:HTH-type transcriptional regulator/antitoxin HigA
MHARSKPPRLSQGDVLPPAYLHLLEQFRLRPIRTGEELDRAAAVVDQLVSRREALLPEEEEYLDILSDLIERYEEEAVPIPDVTGAAMLRFLIEQRGVTQHALAKETGIASSTISAVLKGDRELTRKHIERLAAYFRVAPAVFLPGSA